MRVSCGRAGEAAEVPQLGAEALTGSDGVATVALPSGAEPRSVIAYQPATRWAASVQVAGIAADLRIPLVAPAPLSVRVIVPSDAAAGRMDAHLVNPFDVARPVPCTAADDVVSAPPAPLAICRLDVVYRESSGARRVFLHSAPAPKTEHDSVSLYIPQDM